MLLFMLERLAMARESLAPVRMGKHPNAIRARGILCTAQARQAIRRTRRAAATHGDDRDSYGGTLACCVAQFLYRTGFQLFYKRHEHSTHVQLVFEPS